MALYECVNGEQSPGWYFAHEQDDLNLRIFAHVRRHVFTWRSLNHKAWRLLFLWFMLVSSFPSLWSSIKVWFKAPFIRLNDFAMSDFSFITLWAADESEAKCNQLTYKSYRTNYGLSKMSIVRRTYCLRLWSIQSNLNSSNTDGSFTMANSNTFLSPYEILPIGQENNYLRKPSYFIMKLYVVEAILMSTLNIQ